MCLLLLDLLLLHLQEKTSGGGHVVSLPIGSDSYSFHWFFSGGTQIKPLLIVEGVSHGRIHNSIISLSRSVLWLWLWLWWRMEDAAGDRGLALSVPMHVPGVV